MNRTIFILVFLCVTTSIQAAQKDSLFVYRIDLGNRWIWRGMNFSETPVVQPSFAYKKNRTRLSVWGSYSTGREKYEEIDFIADYDLMKNLNVGLIDYFGFRDTINSQQNFLNFKPTTTHLLDAQLTYKLRNFPLTLFWSTWFWGADRDKITKENNYSSYLEVSWNKISGNYNYGLLAGMTPWKGFYNNGPGIVNLGAKAGTELSVTDVWKIPTEMSLYFNPQQQNLYLVINISLVK